PGGYVPLIFRNQSEREIGATSGHQSEFVGDRSHGTNLELGRLELLPVAALYFAAARKHERSVEVLPLARLCRLAIVGHASFAPAEDEFVGFRIADSASDRNSILHHRDRNTELGDALHELASAVERIDDPDALF